MLDKAIRHYRVLKVLGRGGMGEVFLAQDTILNRKVALKFLSEKLQQDPTAKKRFLQEAQFAAALDHPYICKIYEVGEAEKRSFISMEYVPGQTLQERLERGPLPLKEVLEIAIEVAEALQEAHEKGFIHRDVKPANIILRHQGHVKIMDFGIAKRLPAGSPEELSKSLTASGSLVGTPCYMSPEQLRGHSLDARSDIFSFGVVLYEILTGVNPFARGSVIDTATAILSETVSPLSRYTDDLPVLLQHTVRKMLAKEPDQRYQLIHEMKPDLEELSRMIERTSETTPGDRNPEIESALPPGDVVSSIPPQDIDPSTGPQTREKGQSKQLYYMVAGAVFVIVLSLVLGLFVPWKSPEPLPGLIVQTNLPGAVVFVNEEEVGTTDETGALLMSNLLPGVLKVGVQHEGFEEESQQVVYDSNESKTIAFELKRLFEVQGPAPLPKEVLTPSGAMVLVEAGESLSAQGEGVDGGHADFFFIDKYEVTNELYKKFCDETGRSYPPDPEMLENYFLEKPNFPVVNVSWEEAAAFADWAGKHLPSSQEWERAARSLDQRLWPWGNEPPGGKANLGGKQDGSEYMTSVDAFPLDVSPYGVEQMAGNVAEWTVGFDGTLRKEVPIIKGGSWVNQLADYGKISPVVARFSPEERRRMNGVGFRCAGSKEEVHPFLQVAGTQGEMP